MEQNTNLASRSNLSWRQLFCTPRLPAPPRRLRESERDRDRSRDRERDLDRARANFLPGSIVRPNSSTMAVLSSCVLLRRSRESERLSSFLLVHSVPYSLRLDLGCDRDRDRDLYLLFSTVPYLSLLLLLLRLECSCKFCAPGRSEKEAFCDCALLFLLHSAASSSASVYPPFLLILRKEHDDLEME